MTNNLDIWNALYATDPAHTKKVSQRGGFTAVDAYHQIERMTKHFGPVGSGWGWKVQEQGTLGSAVWVRILFWWCFTHQPDPEVHQYQVYGGAKWQSSKGEMDPDEAYKKALTDALTKAMSYLGMNADIFQGRFHDNKYVQERTVEAQREKAKEQKAKAEENEMFKRIEKLINEAAGQSEMTAITQDIKQEAKAGNLNSDELTVLRSIYKAKQVFLAKQATKGVTNEGP